VYIFVDYTHQKHQMVFRFARRLHLSSTSPSRSEHLNSYLWLTRTFRQAQCAIPRLNQAHHKIAY